MKTALALAAMVMIAATTAPAQDIPYIIGPDGGLHQGIAPDVYFQGLDGFPRDGTQEWCFWPFGCWNSTNPTLDPLAPGPGFSPQAYSFQQFDRFSGQGSIQLNILPVDPSTMQYLRP